MNTTSPSQYLPEASQGKHFRAERFDFWSFFFSGLTGLATLFILGILAVILINIIYNGCGGLSWHFVSTIPKKDFFDANTTGVLPMIVGTTIRVFVMTLFVLPIGVITAIYLTEYAPNSSIVTRIIRAAVNNLAGVPSIVFGLFGLGFFINFIGKNLDDLLHNPSAVWGQPALIWAALTLAMMTMPVVIVATEESLKAIPSGLREASLAQGDQAGNHFESRAATGVAGHHDRRHSCRKPRGGRSGADSFHRGCLLHGIAAASCDRPVHGSRLPCLCAVHAIPQY